MSSIVFAAPNINGHEFCNNLIEKAKNNVPDLLTLAFGVWDGSLSELESRYLISKNYEKEIKEFSFCFGDLIGLSDIISEVFGNTQAKLVPYCDFETGKTYLTVNLPMGDNVKESFEKYEKVKDLWMEKVNPKTITKVFIDLVD